MPHNRITAFSPAQCAYPWWHSTQMVRGHAQVPQPMVETSQHGTYNIGMLDCGEVRPYYICASCGGYNSFTVKLERTVAVLNVRSGKSI